MALWQIIIRDSALFTLTDPNLAKEDIPVDFYNSAADDLNAQARILSQLLKEEIILELLQRQKYKQSTPQPGSLGSLEEMLLETRPYGKTYAWTEERMQPQDRTALYGFGLVALLGLLLPSFRRQLTAIVTRTAQESMELIGQARQTISRAVEDIEDLIAEKQLTKLLNEDKTN
ncbi:MAG: hypothetical protein GX952_00765 [Firmicutes bacterium]|nr:hypothetical protein [Bacillota bacterium]